MRQLFEIDEDSNGRVERVRLMMKPAAWVRLCMRPAEMVGGKETKDRIGADYFGPCCGNTGFVQDILEGVFREGGWIEAAHLIDIHTNLSGHDGYMEAFNEKKAKKYLKMTKAQYERATWDVKLAVIWFRVRDRLAPRLYDIRPRKTNLSDPREAVEACKNGIYALDLELLFSGLCESNPNEGRQFVTEKAKVEAEEFERLRRDQKHANRGVLLARIWPGLKKTYENFKTFDKGPFEGFIMMEAGTDEPMLARSGYCIYKTLDDLRKVLTYHAGDEQLCVDFRRCTVNVAEGLVLGEVVEAGVKPPKVETVEAS